MLGASLYVPGEVTRQQLGFPNKTTLVVSAENLGAGHLAREIIDKYPDLRSEPLGGSLISQRPRIACFGPGWLCALGRMVGRSPCTIDERKRIFLLYLNQETWLGEAGSKLADQVPHRQTLAVHSLFCVFHLCFLPQSLPVAPLPGRCVPRVPRGSA